MKTDIAYSHEPYWVKSVAGKGFDYGVDTELDSKGNIFILGYGYGSGFDIGKEYNLEFDGKSYKTRGIGDAFIAKFSPNRDLLWFKTFGGDDGIYFDEAMDLHIDNNDNLIVLVTAAGNNFIYNSDTIITINSNGQYSSKGILLKLDNNGKLLWYDSGSVSSSFQNIVSDEAGNIYLTGWYYITLKLGNSIEMSGLKFNMFVAKYNSDGVIQWAKNVGGKEEYSSALGQNIAINHNTNNIVVVGRFQKTITFDSGDLTTNFYSSFLVSYDSTGKELWVKSLFDNNYANIIGLDIAPNGMIGVSGYDSFAAGASGLIGFYDSLGATISEDKYFSASNCHLYNIEFNHLNECYLSGYFENSVQLGNFKQTLYSDEYASGMILKFDDKFNLSWIKQLPSTFENRITCKNNRIFYSGRIDDTLIYNYGKDTIYNREGDAIFAEISRNVSSLPDFATENETEISNISIYPNPSNKLFTLEFENFNSLMGYKFNIVSSLGTMVFQGDISNKSISINAENWSNGLYFIQVKNLDGSVLTTKSLVLE